MEHEIAISWLLVRIYALTTARDSITGSKISDHTLVAEYDRRIASVHHSIDVLRGDAGVTEQLTAIDDGTVIQGRVVS